MFEDFLQAHNVFQKHGTENPLLDTVRLFDILSNGALRKIDLSLLRQEKIDLLHLAQKRKEGMPMEYGIGMATFMGFMFYCSPDTLIPREETELLVEVALDFIKKKREFEDDLTAIDMGTGCGSIAISFAMHSDNTKILATDISASAIEIAQKNVNKFNLQERVSLFCGDLFSPFHGLGYEEKIDLVICNPPYIPTASLTKLSPEIIDHEPKVALDAGAFGIAIYRRLISESLSILKPKGILVFEIGVGQEKLVARLIERKNSYENIRYFDDGTHTRVVSAEKKPEA